MGFFPTLLRYNRHMLLCEFKVYVINLCFWYPFFILRTSFPPSLSCLPFCIQWLNGKHKQTVAMVLFILYLEIKCFWISWAFILLGSPASNCFIFRLLKTCSLFTFGYVSYFHLLPVISIIWDIVTKNVFLVRTFKMTRCLKFWVHCRGEH